MYVAAELLVDGDICEMPLLLNKPPLFTHVTRNKNSLLLKTTGNHLRKEAASGVRGAVEDTAGAEHSGIRRAALAAHAAHGHHVHAATVGFVRSARNANVTAHTPDRAPSKGTKNKWSRKAKEI